jgi:type IV pilus assembly protein PilC
MSNYFYVAIDPRGTETRGTVEVADQAEALRRIKEMGLFPTKVLASQQRKNRAANRRKKPAVARRRLSLPVWPLRPRVKSAKLAVFTGQLATVVEAGMPLLRGLRTLQDQEESRALKRVIADLSSSVESGNSFAEAVESHPRVFNRLYVNMVRAGEIGGSLETALRRLAEFMEKAQRIKGKVKAALFYPCAVLTVAAAIMTVLMAFVVPRFKLVFEGLMNGVPLPAFTRFVFALSEGVAHHLAYVAAGIGALVLVLVLVLKTAWGRWTFDHLKLAAPVLGPVFRKAAIARFARTLGTLVSNGVPILQALTIVQETAGNRAVGEVIGRVHENVKQGEPIAPTLKGATVFPALVAGMVDVGEQTGALPEMLMKIADNYDEEVDNATSAMTSLLEPVLIVVLAVVVGSIVIAMFLPLIWILTNFDHPDRGRGE